MTEEQIAEKALEFEFTDGIYGFKEGVKWIMNSYNLRDDNKKGTSVDLNTFTISHNGNVFRLAKRVTKLIHYFVLNKNRVITRDELIKNIWPQDVCVGERTVDVHIKKIKDALGSQCVQTVKGIGYSWIG